MTIHKTEHNDLVARLRSRYTPESCPVCGGPLDMVDTGRITPALPPIPVYACAAMAGRPYPRDPRKHDEETEHYAASHHHGHPKDGDPDVIALLDHLEAETSRGSA